jgi:L-ascorbate metabolism protein UlaG (beta-lactamase superfamily)
MADRITFVGHSTALIELAGVRLLTDPILRDRVLHIRRQVPSPAPETWREIDAVLISHTHADHLDPPSLRRVGRDAELIVPRRTRRTLALHGIWRGTTMAVGDVATVGAVDVEAVPAAHEGRRWPIGLDYDALGYIVSGGGRRIYFPGDTAPFDSMGEVAGGVDVALLPIWGWHAKLNRRHHLAPDTAAEAAAAIRPRIVIPIHWGALLQIGLEGRREELFERPVREFAEHMRRLAPEVDVRVLRPGESTALDD